MKTKRQKLLEASVAGVGLASVVALEWVGVPFPIAAAVFLAFVVASLAVLYKIRRPRVLARWAVLIAIAMALGSGLTAIFFPLLDRLPDWANWLLALAAVGYWIARHERSKKRTPGH